MSVFGVSLLDLLLLTFCFSVPFAVLAVVVTVLYRRDRRMTPPEPVDVGTRYPEGRGGPVVRPTTPAGQPAQGPTDDEPANR